VTIPTLPPVPVLLLPPALVGALRLEVVASAPARELVATATLAGGPAYPLVRTGRHRRREPGPTLRAPRLRHGGHRRLPTAAGTLSRPRPRWITIAPPGAAASRGGVDHYRAVGWVTLRAPLKFRARVLDGIRKFLEDQAMAGKTGAREFYEFEKELHARLMQAEREIVGSVMAASDVDADAVEIQGRVHRRTLRSAQTYMTAAGPVSVERWLYKDRRDPTAHALAALDLKLGIVEGFWTQRAAEQATGL